MTSHAPTRGARHPDRPPRRPGGRRGSAAMARRTGRRGCLRVGDFGRKAGPPRRRRRGTPMARLPKRNAHETLRGGPPAGP